MGDFKTLLIERNNIREDSEDQESVRKFSTPGCEFTRIKTWLACLEKKDLNPPSAICNIGQQFWLIYNPQMTTLNK